ncbi:MAG: ribbon-helix-helix domain-containing protein [Pseudomonadota bacterium]|nr:ribbon-helix-helix domain-containing protein [Pseudomonadota bacterium]
MAASESPQALRQRFFQRQQARLSIKLEEEFWKQLEICAAMESRSLNELVFDIAGSADSTNRSSALRTYCVLKLGQAFEKARLASSNVDVQTLLTACPSPCVILTPERKIAAHNAAFFDTVLKPVIEAGQEGAGNINLRFTISSPLRQIVKAILESKQGYAEASVAFYHGDRMRQMLGRFCLLNRRAQAASPILCYLRRM